MKQNLPALLTVCAVSFLTSTALAQSPAHSPGHSRDFHPSFPDPILAESSAGHLHGAVKASDLLGMSVRNHQGKKLGRVQEVAVDVESGRVLQVILNRGLLVHEDDRIKAVPPEALHHDVTGQVLHLAASREKLQAAPRFTTAQWAEHSDPAHVSAVYAHYGESSPAATGRPEPRTGPARKLSKLWGARVNNLQAEKIGRVDDLLVDLPAGRIVTFVVSSRSTRGAGDELTSLPPGALRTTPDRSALQLDSSREMLSSAPHFEANQWPDFTEPGAASGLAAYRGAPDSTNQVAALPDDTRRNVRDRLDQALAPGVRGDSRTDADITAQIRQAMMDGKELAESAKNTTVTTQNGRVTLRGTVNTAGEKITLGDIANRVARPENVDNQLNVRQTTAGN